MSEATVSTSRVPWWFWLVAVVALLWNAFGGYDYTMTQMQGDAYLTSAGMTAEQIAYLHAMPSWMTAMWAIGVWGAVAGSILLLMRSRYAVWAFAASLAGLIVSLIYTHVLTNGLEVYGQQALIMNAVITAGALFFLWFSWRQAKNGLLR